MQKSHKSINKQKGAALIFMAFIIGLAVIAYLLHALDPARLRLEQDKKTMQTLNEAKQALIAWSANHPNTPGLMPYPDRNNDGNYDDRSDCFASNVNFAPNFTLGRLPLFQNDPNCINAKNIISTGLEEDFRDGAGERLWYEVSSNLLHDYKNNGGNPNGTSPVINPSIVNNPNPIYPWFVVRDRNGAVISSRVAAVIISPGALSGTQDRSGGIANANQYLDKIVMADGTPYQNYGYQVPATNPIQEFIIGDDYRAVAKNDPTYKDQLIEPYYYNDKLVYITIDELMAAIEKRVLEETKHTLKTYYATNNYYPFAAGLGSSTNPNQSVQGNYRGLLPVKAPLTHTCTCTGSTKTCNCNFSVVSSISFTRNSGSFVVTGGGLNAPTGACTVSAINNKVCTCNGAGSCKRSSGAVQFSCTACGQCFATVVGTNIFNTTGTFTGSTGICTNTSSQASCPTTANGTFTFGASADLPIPSMPTAGGLPTWFLANQWEDYIYYATSSNCTSSGANCTSATPQLTVGSTPNNRAILASPGPEIISTPFAASKAAIQSSRPSCDLKDYLDTVENTNQAVANGSQDNLYQPTQIRGQSYNDQIVIVAP